MTDWIVVAIVLLGAIGLVMLVKYWTRKTWKDF